MGWGVNGVMWYAFYDYISGKIASSFLQRDMNRKIIYLSGASTGIGRASAAQLARRGDLVFAADISMEGIESLHREYPSNVFPIVCDFTNYESCEESSRYVREKLVELDMGKKGLDAIVNCASTGTTAPLVEMNPGDFKTIFDINVVGVFNVIRSHYSLLRHCSPTAYFPRIINLSSEAAFAKASSCFMPVSAAKMALESMSTSLRQELQFLPLHKTTEEFKYDGFANVVVINPGVIDTEDSSADQLLEHLKSHPDSNYRAVLTSLNEPNNQKLSKRINPVYVADVLDEAVHTETPLRRYTIGVGGQARVTSVTPQVILEWYQQRELAKKGLVGNFIQQKY